MPETTEHAGGCLCGAVRFKAEGAPIRVGHCHCDMCRKASGAPIVTFANFATEKLAFTKGAPTIYRSSSFAQRGFCADCGSQLTFQADASPERIAVNVGCLDHPEAVQPTVHMYAVDQLPWMKLDDGLPCHDREAPLPPPWGDAS